MARAELRHLHRTALRLQRLSGSRLPALWLFTDPERTPDPAAAATRLPRGSALVFRHFGRQGAERLARRLRAVTRRRGVRLLIGADARLARRVRADGVHWPERLIRRLRRSGRVRGLNTAAAHGVQAARRASAEGADAVVLSPVFASRSPSAGTPLGARRFAVAARSVRTPVIALGGMSARTVRRLLGSGAAGLAAVEALA